MPFGDLFSFQVLQVQEKPTKTLISHSDPVDQVIFLPDGRLASCSRDQTVKLWDPASGKELFALAEHTGKVLTIAMLPNGWLASGSTDGTIKVWDLEEKRVKTFQRHTRSVLSLKALKNGNLVSCSLDDTLAIWDPYRSKNNLLLTINGHGNTNGYRIPIGVLSNDFLVACSRNFLSQGDSILRVWDSRDGRLVKSLPAGLDSVQAFLVLSNDQVAIGTAHRGTIKIIDLNYQSETRTLMEAHDLTVTSLQQLSNENLVSSGQDRDSSYTFPSIKVWSFLKLSLLQHIRTDHSKLISSLSISHDETLLASGSHDTNIKLWPINTLDPTA